MKELYDRKKNRINKRLNLEDVQEYINSCNKTGMDRTIKAGPCVKLKYGYVLYISRNTYIDNALIINIIDKNGNKFGEDFRLPTTLYSGFVHRSIIKGYLRASLYRLAKEWENITEKEEKIYKQNIIEMQTIFNCPDPKDVYNCKEYSYSKENLQYHYVFNITKNMDYIDIELNRYVWSVGSKLPLNRFNNYKEFKDWYFDSLARFKKFID